MPYCCKCQKLKKSPAPHNRYTCNDCQRLQGEKLRDEGIAQVIEATDDEWKQEAFDAIRNTALNHEFFTMDDIHDTADRFDLMPARSPPVWGGLVKAALKDGIMEISPNHGWVKSRRPVAHARPIPVYRSLTYYRGGRNV